MTKGGGAPNGAGLIERALKAEQTIQLEFGARAAGEPHHVKAAIYDIAHLLGKSHRYTCALFTGAVAEHKSIFFVEKNVAGVKIDYFAATSGQLQLSPTGESLNALESDYAVMLEDGLLALNQPSFADIEQRHIIQNEANRQAL